MLSSSIFGHKSFPLYFICVFILCYLVEDLLEHLRNVLLQKHFGNANLVENFILQRRKNMREPFLDGNNFLWECRPFLVNSSSLLRVIFINM